MQNLFLLNDGQILIQSNNKTYQDTEENFLLDLKEDIPQMKVDGKSQNINEIDYNQHSESCWLNGKAFQPYPNEFCEKVLAGIDTLLENQTARNYKAPTLAELKAAKEAEVNAWTAAKITGGFTSEATGEPILYDSDVDTQITVSRMRANCENQRFAELYPNGMECRGRREEGAEKEIFMLQPAEIIRLDEDLGIHIRECKIAGWTQQAKVKAAQTKEDLEAIILN